MRLILSTKNPRNSTYSTEAGEVLYKVHKPRNTGTTVATVRKAVGTVNGVWAGDAERLPTRANLHTHTSHTASDQAKSDDLLHDDNNTRPISPEGETFADSDSGDEASGSVQQPTLEGQFAFYAQVEFHHLRWNPSHFRYNGLDVPTDKFFRKEGWSLFGRDRIFKASDGKEYRWQLVVGYLKMVTNDEYKTPVVTFKEYQHALGPLQKGRPGTLEIDPSCIPILDEIIMTFIYCHKLRKDRDGNSRGNGGGGP